MSPETEPTPWELMRVLRDIREDVRSMKSEMVTREEWTAAQGGINQRFLEHDRRMVEWKQESQLAHAELDAEIEKNRVRADTAHTDIRKEIQTVRTEAAETAEKSRTQRASVWIGIGVAVLAGILPRLLDIFQGGVTP